MSMTIRQIPFEEVKELPEIVYKYRNWNDEHHKTILTELSVFMAPPKSFEDKKDCKLLKRYDLMTHEDIWQKYYDLGKRQNPHFTELDLRQFADEWFKKSPMLDPNYVAKMQEETFDQFNERFGVLSLTANQKNLAMWKKYACDHMGFCVGFDTQIMFKYLGGGGIVWYVQQLPDILHTDSMELEFMKQVFHKEEYWKFEEEYRTHYFWPNTASIADRTRKLPAECYKEVIFGALMPEKHRTEIKAICKEKKLKVTFYEQVLGSDGTVKLQKLI